MHANSGTGIAVLRRDGFCSLSADVYGTVTTRPIQFDGKYLYVNACCTGGSLKAEILDADGNVIPGFSLAESIPMTDDSTITRLTWSSGESLGDLAGQPVKIRFTLRNANLYSFWLTPFESGASRGYVAGGGPGYHTDIDMEGTDAYRAAESYPNLK